MALNQITKAHIEQVMRELDNNLTGFTKKTFARTRTENPYYAVLVEGIARQLEKSIAAQPLSPTSHSEELTALVYQVGMICYHALELAALNGAPVNNAIMSDPNFGASKERSDAALEEARLLIMKIKLLDSNRGAEA